MTTPVRVCHVISGLRTGGAEHLLARLIQATQGAGLHSSVVSLREPTPLSARLEEAGISVRSLDLAPTFRTALKIAAIRSAVLDTQPDVVQGWLYHGNLTATLAAAGTRIPHLWNVQGSLYDIRAEPPGMQCVIRTSRFFSRRPRFIVYDSFISLEQHRALGFASGGGVHIASGFDTRRFAPHPRAADALRRRLGLPSDARLVAHVGRLHRQKNLPGFLKAGALLRAAHPEVVLILAGLGVTEENPALRTLRTEMGLDGHAFFLGVQEDMPGLLAGLDVLCLTSTHGEGTPNVLGEAMSCGTVCVTTDVGDSARLLAEPEYTVPPGDDRQLSTAMERALSLGPEARSQLANRLRARIESAYSLQVIAAEYTALYRRALSPGDRAVA